MFGKADYIFGVVKRVLGAGEPPRSWLFKCGFLAAAGCLTFVAAIRQRHVGWVVWIEVVFTPPHETFVPWNSLATQAAALLINIKSSKSSLLVVAGLVVGETAVLAFVPMVELTVVLR